MPRPPGFDREKVLQAAENQFRRTGYAGTSVDDLTAATGLGRGSLYGSFGDKHHLLLLSLGEYRRQIVAEVEQMLAGPDAQALPRSPETPHLNSDNPGNPATARSGGRRPGGPGSCAG